MRRALGIITLALAAAGLSAQAPAVRPVSPVAPQAGSRHFDPQRVELSRHERRWLLTFEGQILKDFGPGEHDARTALQLIQKLGLDEMARVGPEGGGMEYWLAAGKAPSVLTRAGLRTVAIDPNGMRVERMSGQWCVRDDARVYCAFGGREADARHALEVMRKHQFIQAGLIGHGTPTMTVFFTRPEAEFPSMKVPHASSGPGSSRTMGVSRFPRLAKNPDGSEKKVSPKATSIDASPALIPPPVAPAVVEKRAPMWRGKKADPMPAGPDGRTVFDWRLVQMNLEGGNCHLAAGSRVLASFGGDADAARTALSAIRYYRCSERWTMPGEVAGHWFVVPQVAPRGVMFGLQATPVRPDKMQVVQDGARFALAEGDRLVLPMGSSAADAARLLEMMQKMHIDRITRLGLPGPDGIAFLMRSR